MLARTFERVEQTPFNLINAYCQRRLSGVDSMPVSAELARVNVARDMLGRAMACFAMN